MSELSPQQKVLGQQILADQIPEARQSAQYLGPAAGPVLEIMAKNQMSQVRMLVLELAPLALSAESSRAVIQLLSDSNNTVHAVAVGDLAVCIQKEVVPDMLKVLEHKPDTEVTQAVLRQIGIAGDRNNLNDLSPYRSSQDADVAHQASTAMARLGDAGERDKIIAALSSTDPTQRVRALRDCQYLADKGLIRYFGPPLDDLRDYMIVTPPHVEPVVTARVCDIAVQAIAYLGFQLSYPAQFLARHSLAELAEAKTLVATQAQVQ